ncbi:MAG: tripartite tricarboxylate transporter permease, partial [Pseudomonadota bacterium]
GYVIGAMPGFDITTGVALLLPLSYMMGQVEALAFFSAMYCAGVFGGSITAILFGIPGTSESVTSAIEGYKFTRRGEAGRALGIAVACSGGAGIAASFVLLLAAPAVASVSLKFGPGEYAALGLLGCAAVVSSGGGRDFLKGFYALLLGLFLATVGPDPMTGEYRFVVTPVLQDGVGLIPALIGLFAVSDILWRLLVRDLPEISNVGQGSRLMLPSIKAYAGLSGAFSRSWLIGLFTGVLPGAGASSAAFIAHSTEVRVTGGEMSDQSPRPSRLAAPETAKNAAAVGALIPLLALGIPGSSAAAVILGAFEIHSLQAGPLLFSQHPQLANMILMSVLLANIVFMASSVFLMRPVSMLARIPFHLLAVGVLVLSVTGSVATGGVSGAAVMVGMAMLGILLRLLSWPLAPVILGVVLGPIIEVYLRRGLLMADGDIGALFGSPMCIILLAAALAMLFAQGIVGMCRQQFGR